MDRHKILIISKLWALRTISLFIVYCLSLLTHPFSFEFVSMVLIQVPFLDRAVKRLGPLWIAVVASSSCLMLIPASKQLLHFSAISFMYPSAKFGSDAYNSDFISLANAAVFLVLALLPSAKAIKPSPNAVRPSKLKIIRPVIIIVGMYGYLKINTLIVWLGISTTPDRWGLALINDVQTDPFVALLLAAGTLLSGSSLCALLLVHKQVN